MKCPTCADSVLVMAERAGIEIDYCPTCRGVWLDRGELDKIIERSASAPPGAGWAAPAPMPAPAATPTPGPNPNPSPSPNPGSGSAPINLPEPARARRWDDDDDDDDRRRHHDGHHQPGPYGKKKRKSFLSDIFDFD